MFVRGCGVHLFIGVVGMLLLFPTLLHPGEQPLRAAAIGSPELAEWAMPRVHEGQRQNLVEQHIGRWAKRDREAVTEWVGTIEAGELRGQVQAVLDGLRP